MDKILVVTGFCFKPREAISLIPKIERVNDRELLERSFIAIINCSGDYTDGTMTDQNGISKLFCIEFRGDLFGFTQQCLDAPRPRPGYIMYAFKKAGNEWLGTYTDYSSGKQLEGLCRCYVNDDVRGLFSFPYHL